MTGKIVKTRTSKPKQVFGSNGVFFRFLGEDGGPVEIRFDFGLVPPPAFYYYADSLLLNLDSALRMAILSFGRRDVKTNHFADRIDVVMPKKSLFGQFWASSRDVEGTVDKILDASGGSLPKFNPVALPESQAPTLFSNTIFAAVGEGESTLDFYHLSPREVHLAKTQKREMQIQPTVRIIMSSVLTKQFFDALRPHAELGQNEPPILERSRRAIR